LDDSEHWLVLDNLTTLVLGQGKFWGSGLQILPDADPTDGCMDVVALQGLGLWDFVSKGMWQGASVL
jgi:diacylglycerol kinase family enzyme